MLQERPIAGNTPSAALGRASIKMGSARALVDLLAERLDGRDGTGVECLDLLGAILADVDELIVYADDRIAPPPTPKSASAKGRVAPVANRKAVRR